MIKLDSQLEKKLLTLPESGMGYQIVNATFADRSIRESIVLNADILEPLNNRNLDEVLKSLFSQDLEYFEKSQSRSNMVIDVSLKSDKGYFQKAMMAEARFKSEIEKSTGADKQPEGVTGENEKYVRFSHFENDKRIDRVNWKALPGTYATTLADATYCLGNRIDPRSRYALPNSLVIKFAFHIHPLKNTPIKRGICEPANNQPGGGIEVIFTQGTHNNTVVKVENI